MWWRGVKLVLFRVCLRELRGWFRGLRGECLEGCRIRVRMSDIGRSFFRGSDWSCWVVVRREGGVRWRRRDVEATESYLGFVRIFL